MPRKAQFTFVCFHKLYCTFTTEIFGFLLFERDGECWKFSYILVDVSHLFLRYLEAIPKSNTKASLFPNRLFIFVSWETLSHLGLSQGLLRQASVLSFSFFLHFSLSLEESPFEQSGTADWKFLFDLNLNY